jgi:hypothetical protein
MEGQASVRVTTGEGSSDRIDNAARSPHLFGRARQVRGRGGRQERQGLRTTDLPFDGVVRDS